MKKKFVTMPLVLLLIFSLIVPANAAIMAPTILPDLSFDGTTAVCEVTIIENDDDEIRATISLWNGSKCVETWTATGTLHLHFLDSATVTRGKTYTLKVDAVVDGVAYSTVSVSGRCP